MPVNDAGFLESEELGGDAADELLEEAVALFVGLIEM